MEYAADHNPVLHIINISMLINQIYALKRSAQVMQDNYVFSPDALIHLVTWQFCAYPINLESSESPYKLALQTSNCGSFYSKPEGTGTFWSHFVYRVRCLCIVPTEYINLVAGIALIASNVSYYKF